MGNNTRQQVRLQFLPAKDEELARQLVYVLAVLWRSSTSSERSGGQVLRLQLTRPQATSSPADLKNDARRLTAFIRRSGRRTSALGRSEPAASQSDLTEGSLRRLISAVDCCCCCCCEVTVRSTTYNDHCSQS